MSRDRHAFRCQAAAAQERADDSVAEEDADGDVCLPPDISADNDSHKEYSIVTIEVAKLPHFLCFAALTLVLMHAWNNLMVVRDIRATLCR